jgi:hypothetical protein
MGNILSEINNNDDNTNIQQLVDRAHNGFHNDVYTSLNKHIFNNDGNKEPKGAHKSKVYTNYAIRSSFEQLQRIDRALLFFGAEKYSLPCLSVNNTQRLLIALSEHYGDLYHSQWAQCEEKRVNSLLQLLNVHTKHHNHHEANKIVLKLQNTYHGYQKQEISAIRHPITGDICTADEHKCDAHAENIQRYQMDKKSKCDIHFDAVRRGETINKQRTIDIKDDVLNDITQCKAKIISLTDMQDDYRTKVDLHRAKIGECKNELLSLSKKIKKDHCHGGSSHKDYNKLDFNDNSPEKVSRINDFLTHCHNDSGVTASSNDCEYCQRLNINIPSYRSVHQQLSRLNFELTEYAIKLAQCADEINQLKNTLPQMMSVRDRVITADARVANKVHSTITTPVVPKLNRYDEEITTQEVIDALINLKSFKSIGSDYIPIELLKCCLDTSSKYDKKNDLEKSKHGYVHQHFNKDNIYINVDDHGNALGVKNRRNRYAKQFRSTVPQNTDMLESIVKLFNIILTTSVIPSAWCISYITMLYKKGDKTDPSNYRPITIMPNLQKVFHKIIATRIIKYDINIISNDQCAYLPNRNRDEHIASLLDYYHTRNNDVDTPVYSSFIDLKAAFDSLDHGLLMKFIQNKLKLSNDCKMLKYLTHSYANMNYSVKQNG